MLARPMMNRLEITVHGAVAQLGERNAGSVEVGGSIPLSSTSLLE